MRHLIHLATVSHYTLSHSLIIFFSVTKYLLETNVQLGASYKVAKQSTQNFAKGLTAAASFINADVDEIGITTLFDL